MLKEMNDSSLSTYIKSVYDRLTAALELGTGSSDGKVEFADGLAWYIEDVSPLKTLRAKMVSGDMDNLTPDEARAYEKLQDKIKGIKDD